MIILFTGIKLFCKNKQGKQIVPAFHLQGETFEFLNIDCFSLSVFTFGHTWKGRLKSKKLHKILLIYLLLLLLNNVVKKFLLFCLS